MLLSTHRSSNSAGEALEAEVLDCPSWVALQEVYFSGRLLMDLAVTMVDLVGMTAGDSMAEEISEKIDTQDPCRRSTFLFH